MLKEKLNQDIKRTLENKLKDAEHAAKQAHDAATDDQSIAETQYDTLAIESAYLAEGQSRRINLYRDELNWLESYNTQTMNEAYLSDSDNKVRLGSLVTIVVTSIGLKEQLRYYYIMPIAAGLEIAAKVDHQDTSVTVITPKSPLGLRLLDCQLDEEIELSFNTQSLIGEIIEIR